MMVNSSKNLVGKYNECTLISYIKTSVEKMNVFTIDIL
jgi:hypothetical protein